MSVPDLGTIVIVNEGSGAYFPGIVAVTHDSWTENMGTGDYAVTQPDQGDVYVFLCANYGNTNLVGPLSLGAGTSQFSPRGYQVPAA